jgi:transposase
VKPFVKRQKNDAADAEAICEAVSRPSMRFVPLKSAEQQGVLVLHRTRDLLIRQRTMLANALRAHMAEFGIIEKLGSAGLEILITQIGAGEVIGVPAVAREGLLLLAEQIRDTQSRVTDIEKRILAWHRSSEVSQRLETIPGIGPIIASAIAATVTEPGLFASGRQLSAWLGLVPRQHSSGGKERLRGITKQGDPYIRRLLIIGATAVLRFSRHKAPTADWTSALMTRRPSLVVAVALANKMARIAWAILTRGEVYRTRAVSA